MGHHEAGDKLASHLLVSKDLVLCDRGAEEKSISWPFQLDMRSLRVVSMKSRFASRSAAITPCEIAGGFHIASQDVEVGAEAVDLFDAELLSSC